MGAKQKWTSPFLVLPMGITSRCVEREGALVKNVCKLMDGDDGLAGWSWGLEDRNPVVVSTKYEYLASHVIPIPGLRPLCMNRVAMVAKMEVHMSSSVWAHSLPSNVTVEYPTWFGRANCLLFRNFVSQLT